MASIGGDITELTFNHPTIGSGTLFVKASEDSTFDLGGLRSNDDANGVDGGGNTIRQMNHVRWFVEVTASWDMNTRKDLEKVTAMAADPVEAEWTVSHINGVTYGGTGSPVGDLNGNGNTATFPLKISGGGVLKQIA